MDNPQSIYERCHFTCAYCGYDGRAFDSWMQLSIDHILPIHCHGTDELSNLVVACGSCNSITSRMQFSKNMSREQILEQKRVYVATSRSSYYKYWLERVAPKFLDRPVPTPPV